MDKIYRNYILKNIDAYYLAIDAFFEFPSIKEHEVGQLINDEFGYDRFKKTAFMKSVLVACAKNKHKDLTQNYENKETEGE